MMITEIKELKSVARFNNFTIRKFKLQSMIHTTSSATMLSNNFKPTPSHSSHSSKNENHGD